MDLRPIPDWPEYFVDENGNVYSTKRGALRALRRGRNPVSGYLLVSLHQRDGRERTMNVHRLVAEVFLGPPPFHGAEARHVNGKADDPRAENLCWGTHSENEADRNAHGTGNRGERHGLHKLTAQSVREIRQAAADGETHQSIADAHGVSREAIGHIVNRRRWKHVT